MSFEPSYGTPVEVIPGLFRLTAPNPGPMTGPGTNTYLLGDDRCAIIDPGPQDETHLQAILDWLAGRPLEAILLTHRHKDHSGLIPRLKAATGAPLLAAPAPGDAGPAVARFLSDGERLTAGGFAIEVLATPGHTADHLAFVLPDRKLLLSGDHVMGWSTTVVIPPDGSMRDYMASLALLAERDDRLYLPGHGEEVERPQTFVRAMIHHRTSREQAILKRLASGDRTVPEIVAALYRTIDDKLKGAASLSVLAHLIWLTERGAVRSGDAQPTLDSRFDLSGFEDGVPDRG